MCEREKSSMELWAEKEVEIACKREAPDRKEGEWDYGCACFESALKAYKSLLEDGHSGGSIALTRQILNRLIDGEPLTPIEDTDDIWKQVFTLEDEQANELGTTKKTYQCLRKSSLFKDMHADGSVSYTDVNRVRCCDVDDPTIWYHSGLVSNLFDEMFPIEMPYIPCDEPYKVYCEKFLFDRKNGDYDTVGIFYGTDPDGKDIDIGRYFKDSEDNKDPMIETSQAEYVARFRSRVQD